MNKGIEVLLLISISLNLLLLLLASIFLKRRGGLSYLIRKIPFIEQTQLQQIIAIKTKKSYDSSDYWSRRSQLQLLPKSNHEIIFLGDSITNDCEWMELFEDLSVKNRGIMGDTTDGILSRLDEIVESQPRKIFLMVGINDLVNEGKSVMEIYKTYKKILLIIREKSPETKVLIQSVLSINRKLYRRWENNNTITKLNFQLQELAKELSMQYIDLFTPLSDSQNQLDAQYTLDGIHLNGSAYLIWKQVIEKYILE